MSDQNMEPKVKELMELRRMKEELEAEITALEDQIKARMGNEETLLAGAFKVSWTTYTASRFDSTRLRQLTPSKPPPAASPSTKSRSTYHSTPAMPHR